MGALDRVLAKKAVMLVVTLATLGGTVFLYMAVPKGFLPAGGHRVSDRRDRSRNRYLVRGDDDSAAGAGRRPEIGPLQWTITNQQHRRFGRPKSYRELRPAVHRFEAAETA